MVCYYLRIAPNCNVVLLVNLKYVPGVLDGDRGLGKMGSTAELICSMVLCLKNLILSIV